MYINATEGETGDNSGDGIVQPGALMVADGRRDKGSPSSRPAAESGLEMLQLKAKGQALARAVVVVEGVLHKMEEQASKTALVQTMNRTSFFPWSARSLTSPAQHVVFFFGRKLP